MGKLPNEPAKTAPSLSIFETTRPTCSCWATARPLWNSCALSSWSMFGIRVIFPCWGSVQQSLLFQTITQHYVAHAKSTTCIRGLAKPFSDTSCVKTWAVVLKGTTKGLCNVLFLIQLFTVTTFYTFMPRAILCRLERG